MWQGVSSKVSQPNGKRLNFPNGWRILSAVVYISTQLNQRIFALVKVIRPPMGEVLAQALPTRKIGADNPHSFVLIENVEVRT